MGNELEQAKKNNDTAAIQKLEAEITVLSSVIGIVDDIADCTDISVTFSSAKYSICLLSLYDLYVLTLTFIGLGICMLVLIFVTMCASVKFRIARNIYQGFSLETIATVN